MKDVYKVLAYRTIYEVISKSPRVIITPPVTSKREAEVYAREIVPDPFMLRVRSFDGFY